METSVSHYTANDLYKAFHTNELVRRPETIVNLDVKQCGLGGASCGPGTLPQYLVPPGQYDFTIAAWDNGLPSKRTERSFTLEILEEEVDDTPPFAHAGQTKIQQLSRNVKGQWEVAIYFGTQTQNSFKRMIVGESFKLDGKTWTIKKVDGSFVTLDVDGKLLVFKNGSFLNSPELKAEPQQTTTSTEPGIK